MANMEEIKARLSDVRIGASQAWHKLTRQEYDAWETYGSRNRDTTGAHRDVYYGQQVARSTLGQKQTMASRRLAVAGLSIGIAVLFWILVSLVSFLFYTLSTGHLNLANPMQSNGGERTLISFFGPTFFKVFCSLLFGTISAVFFYVIFRKQLDAQNVLNEVVDINQYQNDQHIMFPEEMQAMFDYFPDVGGHSSVEVSSMISHMALRNKGLNTIRFVRRHADKNDDSEFYDILDGNEDSLDIVEMPWMDEDFARDLFKQSGVTGDEVKFYDATAIEYNPGNKSRDKLKGYDTVADLINGDWEFPLYEPQRPGGVYLVDTAPVNTMVLAITRAGKGQTVIEPTIDMWLREKKSHNMVINDPKGELLVKNYVPATVRGFQVVQFNLINALKTDIYNPLIMAAQAAREGDSVKCAQYVENIAEVFFPLDGGEDPVWPNAANNAFKRASYGLIDYYLEEERQQRRMMQEKGESAQVIDTAVDNLWGKVTLYNAYQLFVQLTAKKRKNPAIKFNEELQAAKDENGKFKENSRFKNMTQAQFDAERQYAEKMGELWDGNKELDLLSLYFNATDRLPRNSMRTLVANANNALKAMGGAEKMMASVYGIAITAMSFFADPTIYTLTSGTPSQNVDLAGLSFPRRVGVRLHPDFMQRFHLIGLQCRWQAFSDPSFAEEFSLGPDFYHEDLVSREGWCRFYFKGILPEMTAYFRLEIRNAMTGVLVKRFFFRFEKTYQTSLNGKTYVTDPILDQKIIKNGLLYEMRPTEKVDKNGRRVFADGNLTFDGFKLEYDKGVPKKVPAKIPAVISNLVRYSEKQKAVFLVTPPHLAKYAKLLLILISQLVNLNFDQSYMTKSNQKPLYKTRFMLDELGNLQSEGHGISGFETMLSIGLGQEQQFTLILQTLQQLRDVYGDSVDKIVQGNAQPLTSKIATPNGWKTMGEMEVGTEVLTPDGKKAQVVGVYPKGVRKVYRVTRRDGSSCLVCNEHLWKVKVNN